MRPASVRIPVFCLVLALFALLTPIAPADEKEEQIKAKLQAIRKQIDELRRQEQALAKELERIEAATPSTVQKELKKLQGTWKVLASESDGQRPAKGWFLEEFAKAKLTVKEDKLIFSSERNPPWEVAYRSDRKPKLDTYWLDPAKKPTAFTMTVSVGGFLSRSIETVYGIYQLEGDQLTICYSTQSTEKSRPTGFETKQGSERVLLVYEREKPLK
jgi:uncharacterized protein (TIGR03067 family)